MSGERSVSLVLLVLGVDAVEVHGVLGTGVCVKCLLTCPLHNLNVF